MIKLDDLKWMTEEQLKKPVTMGAIIEEFDRISINSYYGEAVYDGILIIDRLQAKAERLNKQLASLERRHKAAWAALHNVQQAHEYAKLREQEILRGEL